MTLEEFFNLANECGPWEGMRLGDGVRVIRNLDNECPICAVASKATGTIYRNTQYLMAAAAIGLNLGEAVEIARHADMNLGVESLKWLERRGLSIVGG